VSLLWLIFGPSICIIRAVLSILTQPSWVVVPLPPTVIVTEDDREKYRLPEAIATAALRRPSLRAGHLHPEDSRRKAKQELGIRQQRSNLQLILQTEIEAGVRGGGARRAIWSKMLTQIMSEDFARSEAHAAKIMTTSFEIIYEMLTR
jgi:hypothetical protein